jgi:chromosomal replication initiation ATPase DnaA
VRHSANTSGEAKRLVARVASHYGLSVNTLLRESVYGSEARNLAMWLPWQNSGLTLREIGSLFGGMDYAAVSQRIRRIQKCAETDKQLQRVFEMLNV